MRNARFLFRVPLSVGVLTVTVLLTRAPLPCCHPTHEIECVELFFFFFVGQVRYVR